MRKQDLRKFDMNLMISVLSVFTAGSFIFLMSWFIGIFAVAQLDLRFMLWISYSIFFMAALIVYIMTKQPTIVWTKPESEKQLTSASKFKLEPGESYLLVGDSQSKARDVFTDAVTHGKKGMFITRTNPMIVKKKLALENSFILWLTEVEAENAINPLDVEDLAYTIKKFLKSAGDGVVLFEGVEYLTNVLQFNKVLHLMQDLRDEIALTSSNFLLNLVPDSFDKRQLSTMAKEFAELK
jgi:signal transduction histidine kinase